jgi:hypothetical protein
LFLSLEASYRVWLYFRLLRAARERPCHRAAETRDAAHFLVTSVSKSDRCDIGQLQ